MLIIHAGDSELVAVDCFECIDAQLDVRENSVMLRMYLMQIWFNLSDEGIEDSIYDSYAMRTFMHIDFNEQQVMMQQRF